MITARLAIEKRLQEIREERQALHDEQKELIQQLREMDREIPQDVPQKIIDEMKECISLLREKVPTLEVHDVIEYLAKQQREDVRVNAEAPKAEPEKQRAVNTPAFQQAVQEAKAAQYRSGIKPEKRKTSGISYKRKKEVTRQYIVSFLSETGEPQTIKSITGHLASKDITYSVQGLYTVIQELMDENLVARLGRGKYDVATVKNPI